MLDGKVYFGAGYLVLALIFCSVSFAQQLEGQESPSVSKKPGRKGIPTNFSQQTYATPSSQIPDIVLSGLTAYQLEGAEAAIRSWVKGGPIESDPAILSSADVFKKVEKVYGNYISHQLIHVEDLTPFSKLVYIEMDYEKGPLFARFLCYRSGSAWVIAGRLVFDTDPQKVLPE